MATLHEEATPFERNHSALAGTPFEGLKRFRTFGASGPMYEVLAVSDHAVRVFLFNSGEQTDYRLDRALTDPVAE